MQTYTANVYCVTDNVSRSFTFRRKADAMNVLREFLHDNGIDPERARWCDTSIRRGSPRASWSNSDITVELVKD